MDGHHGRRGQHGPCPAAYKGFATQGFRIVAAFDADPRVAGTRIEGIPVYGQERLIDMVRQQRIQLGMITVPATRSTMVADNSLRPAYRGIVNFAPVTLSLPADVPLVGVDLTTELEQLAFAVANRMAKR